MSKWTIANIPDQTGRTAIVTGANTGIGFETARMLAGGARTSCWPAATSRRARGGRADRRRRTRRRSTVAGARPDLAGLGPRRGRRCAPRTPASTC